MQGVEVAPAINDENASRLFGPPAAFKENSTLQQATKSAVKPAGRRAFGNITNAQSLSQPQEAGKQQPGTVKRRAFGDITNSTSKPLNNSAAQKPDASQLKLSSTKAKAVAVSEPAAVPTVPWWETAEPEKSAGKTWEQLLADRECQEDAEIEQSVQQLLAGFRNLTSRCLQVQQDDSSEDEVMRPPPLPSSVRDPTAAPASSTPAVPPLTFSRYTFATQDNSNTGSDIDRLLELLPDVELPWPDEEPAAAAAAAAGVSHVPSCISNSSSSVPVTAGAARETQHTTGQQLLCFEVALKHGSGEAGRSSPKPAAGLDFSTGLKSPEPLPW